MSDDQSAVITGHSARVDGTTNRINMCQQAIPVLIDHVTKQDEGHVMGLAWRRQGRVFMFTVRMYEISLTV